MLNSLALPPSNIFQNQTAFFNYYNQINLVANGQEVLGVAGIPFVSPAVILQQYFCQVPQLKSTGSLLVAIIVADLVFLQALWKVLNLVVTFFLERQHPEAKYCAACARRFPATKGGYQLVKKEDEEASEAKGTTTMQISNAEWEGKSPSQGKAKDKQAQMVLSPSAVKDPA